MSRIDKYKIKFYSELLKTAHGEKSYKLKTVLYASRIQYSYSMLLIIAGFCLAIFGLNLESVTISIVGVGIFSLGVGVSMTQFFNDVLACQGLILIQGVLSEEKIKSKIEDLKND